MTGSDAIKSSKGAGDTWGTPFDLWKEIRERYYPPLVKVFDPCPNHKRLLPGTIYGGSNEGLTHDWETFNFVNPPFSDIEPWLDRARSQTPLNGKTVFLLPVRSDQGWWHELARMGRIVFIRGRVNYELPEGGKTAGAPFPSCLIVFDGTYGIDFWTPEAHKNRRKR